MAQVIGTNVASLNAQRNLNTSQAGLQTSLQRLSSGMRINSAKDDAAGLAISQRFTAQINGLDQAARNANDGISLAQTAEGSLSATTDALQRIRQLAVQSANVTNSTTDRAAIQVEVASLKAEIDRVGNNSTFNGVKLLNGSNPTFNFQVGANTSGNDSIAISGLPTATLAGLSTVPSWNGTSTVTGGAVADFTGGATANKITVNGVDIGLVVHSATVATQAANTAAAINAVTNQTGVTATATGAVLTYASTSAAAFTINATGSDAVLALGSATVSSALTVPQYTATATGAVTAGWTASATNFIKINGYDIGTIAAGASGTATAVLLQTAMAAISGSTGVTVTNPATSTLNFTSANGTYVITAGGLGATALSGLTSLTATSPGGLTSLDVSTVAGAKTAIDQIDSALSQVNLARASLGAAQNRFASVVTDLQTTSENLSASRSRISDTDFAAETAALTKNQILQQAGTAMLAQANSLPNSVLTLLKG